MRNKKAHGQIDLLGKVIFIAIGILFVMNSSGGIELGSFLSFLLGVMMVTLAVVGFVF